MARSIFAFIVACFPFFSVFAWTFPAEVVFGQSKKDDQGVPKGCRLETVAATPGVHPVDLAFDDAGNLYVLELLPGKWKAGQVEFRYRNGTVRKREVHRKAKWDRVRMFVRDEKTGRFAPGGILLEEDAPGSLLLADGWLYLTGQGTVRRWRLEECRKAAEKPGTKSPAPEMVVHGLDGMAPGIVRGIDGWLYLICGSGNHFAEGSDGSLATVLGGGAVLRCRPDGSRLHVFATGLRRPRPAAAFDENGILFVLGEPRADLPMRPFPVREAQDMGFREDPARGESHDFTGLLPTGSGDFPETLQDRFLVSDPRKKEIRTWKLRPDGSWGIRPFAEGNPEFHPAGMTIGPDGAVYVADPGTWNSILLDGKGGAIRRLTWEAEEIASKNSWDRWSRLADMKEDDLLGRLGSTDPILRQKARDACVRRGAAIRPGLLKVLADPELPALARRTALGALQDLWTEEVRKAVLERLGDPIPTLRRQCIEALALHAPAKDREVHDSLVAILEERDPEVRRALHLAIGKVAADGAGDVLVNVLRFDEGKSADARAALLRAIERTGREGIRQLLAMADSGVAADRDLVLEAYPALSSREAGEGLALLLKNYHLTPDQKVLLIQGYRKYRLEPPLSLKSLQDYLAWLPAVNPKAAADSKEGRLQRDLVPVRLAGWKVLADREILKSKDLAGKLQGLLEGPPYLRIAAIRGLAESPLPAALPFLKKLGASTTDPEERSSLEKTLEILRKQ